MKNKLTDNHDGIIPDSEIDFTRKRRPRWKAPLFLACLLILGIIWVLFLKSGENNGISYKTLPVEKGDIILSIVATGNLAPTNQVDVGSELSGIIKTVEVDYNDSVRKGQILARLDKTRIEAQVLQSKASLSAAQANLLQTAATVKESRSKLDRILQAEKLSGGRAVSQSDTDTARASLDRAVADEASATAAVSQAQATLDTILTDLSKTDIVSPINGVVLSRSVEPGQTVAASLSAPILFTLAEDLTQMELHVDVDEADVGRVKKGQIAVFTVDAYPNKKFEASVIQVRYGPSTTDGVVTYETLMKVDNKNRLLLPGMTATADITVKKISNILLLPNAALRFSPPSDQTRQNQKERRGIVSKLFPRPPSRRRQQAPQNNMKGQQKVWMLQNNYPVPVFISTGASDGINTEITGGDIREGDELIIESSVPGK